MIFKTLIKPLNFIFISLRLENRISTMPLDDECKYRKTLKWINYLHYYCFNHVTLAHYTFLFIFLLQVFFLVWLVDSIFDWELLNTTNIREIKIWGWKGWEGNKLHNTGGIWASWCHDKASSSLGTEMLDSLSVPLHFLFFFYSVCVWVYVCVCACVNACVCVFSHSAAVSYHEGLPKDDVINDETNITFW